MTNAAKHLLESFEALPAEEQHEVLAQLLRRLTETGYDALPDESLLHTADLCSRTMTARRARLAADGQPHH
jgi:hypothetical protein